MKSLIWTGVVLVMTIIGFAPFRQQKTILIKARYENVCDQLFKPMHWKNWQSDVKIAWQHDSTHVNTITRGITTIIGAPYLRINIQLKGFGLEVRKSTKWQSEHYSFTVTADKSFKYTIVHGVFNTYGYKWLTTIFTNKKPFKDIEDLKNYMQDEKAYYGFYINNILTVDTNVLVVKKTVLLKDKNSAISATQNQLRGYINLHHYNITQPIMADIHPTYEGDSVRIMIGIPIAQRPNSNGDIKLMQMSGLSRQLCITYIGKYGNRVACYNALKRYITDHSFSTSEVPYEKYLDNKIPLSNIDYTHMQIICPVQ